MGENMQTRPAVCTRSVLYVTKVCNINCEFCYYRYEKEKKHKDLKALDEYFRLWKQSDYYKVTHVDLTGGEPTTHPEIRQIIEMSNSYGVKPTIITNGLQTELIGELINCGLDDLLISIHGFENSHDVVVGRKGAFKKVAETINLLHKRNFSFRTNTTLTSYSVNDIVKVTDYLKTIRPRIVNLIAFNPHEGTDWAKKVNLKFQVKYSEMAEAAKYAIDILKQAGIWVNVRYMPLCFMSGYEAHVCGFKQWQFDPYEWEFLSSNRVDRKTYEMHLNNANETFGFSPDEKAHHYIMHISTRNNKSVDECIQCACRNICDGIYPQYLSCFGPDEFRGVAGSPMDDPLAYRITDMGWAEA
jgi:MoaA/NifB/PqqE/SkfB family radical SAM enzyme